MTTLCSLMVMCSLVVPAQQPVASYTCRADTKFGRHTVSLRQTVDAQAPAVVRANTRFTIAVRLRPGTLPGEVKGFTLQEVRDLTLRLPIPANSSYVGAQLAGGSGLNSTPTVRLDGTTLLVTVSGPIPGGASYQLPTLSLRLKSGRPGTVVETKLKGTSYDDPGLTLQAKIKWKFLSTKAPVACYPNPNPALTRTRVTQ
ncbi:hypothetical protein [Kribbella sp. NPDC048915]|uniref:hypothetical protein n=1 Tax=Kribbella sp. NPDC048915 TaxID=3155148 RepID=UPI0034042EC8